MPSRERDIAEAVTDAINAGNYSQSVDAVRTWLPVWKLDGLESLRCSVVPALHSAEAFQRGAFMWDYPIAIGFGKQVDEFNQRDQVDALTDTVEEVVTELQLARVTLDDATQASNFAIEYLRHADAEFLTENSLFVSLVQLTYRIVAC